MPFKSADHGICQRIRWMCAQFFSLSPMRPFMSSEGVKRKGRGRFPVQPLGYWGILCSVCFHFLVCPITVNVEAAGKLSSAHGPEPCNTVHKTVSRLLSQDTSDYDIKTQHASAFKFPRESIDVQERHGPRFGPHACQSLPTAFPGFPCRAWQG
jgi:hypothetical protein